MPLDSKTVLSKMSHFGLLMIVIITGSLLIHIAVFLLDYYLVGTPLNMGQSSNFWDSLFSKAMIPIIIVYALLLLISALFWRNMKKAMVEAHQTNVSKERNDAAIKTAQEMSSAMVSHIACQNNRILQWIKHREQNNHKVPSEIREATHNISEYLRVLTEATYVFPYLDKRYAGSVSYEAFLKERIDKIASQAMSSVEESDDAPEELPPVING